MATNGTLKIFTGPNPNVQGKKSPIQLISLELQLEMTTKLDDLKELLFDGYKVHRNNRPNYRHEFLIGFPPKPLDWGR